MANKKLSKKGECLVRIAIQSKMLCEYILDEKANKGKISLKMVKDMSNVIVSNVKLLEEMDLKDAEKQQRNVN